MHVFNRLVGCVSFVLDLAVSLIWLCYSDYFFFFFFYILFLFELWVKMAFWSFLEFDFVSRPFNFGITTPDFLLFFG